MSLRIERDSRNGEQKAEFSPMRGGHESKREQNFRKEGVASIMCTCLMEKTIGCGILRFIFDSHWENSVEGKSQIRGNC